MISQSKSKLLPLNLFVIFLFFLSSPAFSSPPVVKVGVSSMITPVDTVKYYQDIIDYLASYIKEPLKMVHRRTYAEMDHLLEKGEVKIAFICSAPYVTDRERFGVELLVAPVVDGNPFYHSYIIVHRESPIRTFSELRGKRFAFTDPNSNSGKLYPTYLVKKMGFTPNEFFSSISYSYSHNKSIEWVAKKIVDGGAVDSIVYDHMMATASPYVNETKVIKRSPPFGSPPVVTVRSIDPGLKKKIKQAILNMHRTDKGKSILASMMIDRFVEVPDSNYDTIRKMKKEIEEKATISVKIRDQSTVYFGLLPRDNPRLTYEKYQPLLDYLASKTPYRYELVLKKDYKDTVRALGTGEMDVALLGPITYLEAYKAYRVRCLLRPKGSSGMGTMKSVFITKESSSIKSISDIRGKSVAFASIKSTTGNLIPRHLLATHGIHLSDLKNYTNFDYHDSVVKAVLRGQYDVGAVRDVVANKYMKSGLFVIATSASLPTGPLVARKDLPSEITDTIKKILLALDPQNGEDRKALERLDEELKQGFIEATDKTYDDIREKINVIPKTCGVGCHPKLKL